MRHTGGQKSPGGLKSHQRAFLRRIWSQFPCGDEQFRRNLPVFALWIFWSIMPLSSSMAGSSLSHPPLPTADRCERRVGLSHAW